MLGEFHFSNMKGSCKSALIKLFSIQYSLFIKNKTEKPFSPIGCEGNEWQCFNKCHKKSNMTKIWKDFKNMKEAKIPPFWGQNLKGQKGFAEQVEGYAVLFF